MIALWVACAVDLSTPRPIALDHAACDHCAMLISDPRFAAELVTRDGEVFEFDDPACWFRYVADRKPAIGAAWFRDSTEPDTWLSWQEVAFVEAPGAPMDGGFAAVRRGTDTRAVTLEVASGRVLGGGR